MSIGIKKRFGIGLDKGGYYINQSNTYIKTFIAIREDCNESMQKMLYEDGDEAVQKALSYHVNLDSSIAIKLLFTEVYGKIVAKYIKLSEEMFEILDGLYSVELVRNESLDLRMQRKLLSSDDASVKNALTLNENIHEYTTAELICSAEDDISFFLNC